MPWSACMQHPNRAAERRAETVAYLKVGALLFQLLDAMAYFGMGIG